MKRITLILILAFLLPTANAAQGDSAGAFRHGLASAALTSMLYITLQSMLGHDKGTRTPSLITSVAFSLATGFAIEMVQAMGRGDRRIDKRDIIANGVGTGIAAITIIAIDF